MEGVLEGIGPDKVDAAILALLGVASIHDLHVWSIKRKNQFNGPCGLHERQCRLARAAAGDTHIYCQKSSIYNHATVQLECTPCEQAGDTHAISP